MPAHTYRRWLSAALSTLLVAVTAALILTTSPAKPAEAHGTTVDPASRNYSCWLRWGSRFQDPVMATEDPMCWQAWQADPNAMWNWNGLYREGVAGNHQGVIPDGQLCSAGHTQSPRYNSMDTVGNWTATSIAGTTFNVKLYDQASHGADYIWVYVTKQGFDPITQALKWSDLELVGQIGKTPAAQWTPESAGGVSILIPASAPGRTGRHMVYTIWQASHMDQSYYFCADVNFGGASPSPSTSASSSPSASPSVSPSASPSTSPSSSSGGKTCATAYTVVNQWSGGFQGEVKVTAGSAAISGWKVTMTWPNGQVVTSAWNGTATTSGAVTTVTNAAWNGSLGAGVSTTFGFLANYSSTNAPPVFTCTAS